eukprot:GFUD01028922.1.p1 GENE.GFUD01028922.1~~GFUD01028922.1.p1  ORF type:complete len:252 (+),score=64.94 GFUD01028922.1:169-924(+)
MCTTNSIDKRPFQKEGTLVSFKENSTLKQFLDHKTAENKSHYTLRQILTILKNIIKKEVLFDDRNPSVVICSPDLEEALNMRAFHVTELWELVASQLNNSEDLSIPEFRRDSHNTKPVKRFYGNPSMTFGLQPSFLSVLRTVEGAVATQTVFSYKHILQLLSQYICSRRATIMDPRNIKLALVENDPLGVAFKVAAFHRCQVRHLLDQQLICLSLTQLTAWNIVRCISSKEIQIMNMPREVKEMLVLMGAA